jgi:uncharacterized protein (DUF302 family)
MIIGLYFGWRKRCMYGYKIQVDLTYAAAVQKMRDELKKEGFGVITEIDVKDTLKKKLNVDYVNYIILGACNPPFAYQALQVEKDVGLMMPCNVVIYEEKGRTTVAAAMPTALMGLVQNEKLKSTAEQIETKLKKAVDSLK